MLWVAPQLRISFSAIADSAPGFFFCWITEESTYPVQSESK
jgi:hypothetical protein